MKIAQFGWESDQIYQKGVTVSYPVLKPIVIRAYSFYLGMMSWKEGLFGADGWSEVLWSATFNNLEPVTEFGPGVYLDQTGGTFNPTTGNVDNGKQNLHGNVVMGNGAIAVGILKMYISRQNSVNKVLALSNLDIKVPGGSQFQMAANHAGSGPVDFECQGVIYYEDVT
jgi:hypothetical protein